MQIERQNNLKTRLIVRTEDIKEWMIITKLHIEF